MITLLIIIVLYGEIQVPGAPNVDIVPVYSAETRQFLGLRSTFMVLVIIFNFIPIRLITQLIHIIMIYVYIPFF